MKPSFEQLIAEVLQDQTLMSEIEQIDSQEVFVTRAVAVAHERGYDDVTETDVHDWIAQARWFSSPEQRRAPLSDAELSQVGGGADSLFC